MWSRSPVQPAQVTGLTPVSAPTCTGTGWTSCICCWCLYWKSYEIIKGVTAKLPCCRTFFFNLLHRQVWWSCLGELLILRERCVKWKSIATVISRRSTLPFDFLLNLECAVVNMLPRTVGACPACMWQCFLLWSLVCCAGDLVQTFWHCACVSAKCWVLLQVWRLEENQGTKEDGSAQGAKPNSLQCIPVPCIVLLWMVLWSISSPFISCPQSLSVVVGNKSIFIQNSEFFRTAVHMLYSRRSKLLL